MKKYVLIFMLLISCSTAVYSQGFTYNFIRGYCLGLGYSIGQEWNASLTQGDYFTKTFNFTGGVEYDIIALSEDMDVLDVDIQILTPGGYVYTQDTKSDRFAEVNFTPTYTRTFIIKVKNYNSNTPSYASKVYFLIAYRD